MKKKINQAQPEGRAQPEIRPGDKWKDNAGSVITISACSQNRVEYFREGYEHPCICSPDRLRREFTRIKPDTLTGWASTKKPAEMAAGLRKIIQASRAHK